MMSYKEWLNSTDYWERLEDNYGVDSETDIKTHGLTTQDLWDLYKEYQVSQLNDKLYNIFMDLIGKLSNKELLTLANSLQEYVKNDEGDE